MIQSERRREMRRENKRLKTIVALLLVTLISVISVAGFQSYKMNKTLEMKNEVVNNLTQMYNGVAGTVQQH